MIGLERGTVRVVPSDDEWPAAFARERHRLFTRIGHLVLDIQHVGSTAVPGLAAKPIIDIAVAVASPADMQRCRPLLVELGYLDRDDHSFGYAFNLSDPVLSEWGYAPFANSEAVLTA